MSQPLRILLVEDVPDDAELLLRKLRSGGYDPFWLRVETPTDFQDALNESWEVIIADYNVPGFGGMEALIIAKKYSPDTPFIIVSGTVGEETAVSVMKAGAQDYLIKGKWARLVPAIAREIAEAKMRRERKQAQKELEIHARNLILLNEITQAASGMLDFKEILQISADRLGELLSADGCYISLWDDKRQIPTPAAAYGSLRNSYTKLLVQPDEPTLTAHVLQTGTLLAIEDTEKSLYLSSRLTGMFPSRAILALPLIVAEQKLGAALISFNEPHQFNPEEVKRGEQAAGQIALAIAKAQLLEAERKQRKLAETLQEITHVLTSSLEPTEVLDLILDQLARVLTYDSASVYRLVDEELVQLAIRTIYDQVNNPVLAVEHFKHIHEVLLNRKPVIIRDTSSDLRWQTLPGKTYTHCWLGVPLITHNQVIGLLNISHGTAYFYDEQDAEIAMAFANQAAAAIENATLYERLRHYARDLEMQVTERTRELAEANEQLKELDRLKTKFVSDVSHELRTPITNLKLYLSLVDRGDPQKRDRYISVINQQTERLEVLIKDILDISRLEGNLDQMVSQPVNLNDLVDRAIALHKQRAEIAGLDLNFQPGVLLPFVSGDATKLQQVIENLLTNAIHYTLSGSINIYTYPDSSGQTVCLAVADTGIGIPLDEQPLLYDRFYRGERTGQSNIPGTGLGLSIVKEIVTMHNGRIELQSELNKGSTFCVWLPTGSPSPGGKNGKTTSLV